jgi:hypothetical protein
VEYCVTESCRLNPGGAPIIHLCCPMSLQKGGPEQRKQHRVIFDRGYPVNIMAIDGTWRRSCTMEDVSESGARLTVVDGSVQGLALKEFFLLLSSTGLAYRRCELAWVNGDQLGVHFLKQSQGKGKKPGLIAI